MSEFISIDDNETSSIIHACKPVVITNDIEDPRICMIKEYLSKCPDATLKDIKSKALLHFSKASEEELKEIIKSANIEKYNELYSQVNVDIISTNTSTISAKSKFSTEEVKFLEQHRHGYNRAEIYEKYKSVFPGSGRKLQFLYDYYYSHPDKSEIRHVQERIPEQVKHTQNHHILAKAITALYKSGKSPKMFSEIKPVIDLISDPNEIDFAIECLTS